MTGMITHVLEAQALASMEGAWGKPASQVFASISPAPVAAASLGQVHIACAGAGRRRFSHHVAVHYAPVLCRRSRQMHCCPLFMWVQWMCLRLLHCHAIAL